MDSLQALQRQAAGQQMHALQSLSQRLSAMIEQGVGQVSVAQQALQDLGSSTEAALVDVTEQQQVRCSSSFFFNYSRFRYILCYC